MSFSLAVAPRITKELLLEKNSQECYFEHYLGIHVKKGLFCCPPVIRNDRTPTCAFYKNVKGTLMFKDFAGESFDFIGCVMYLFQCSYYIALKIIANDFNIIEYKGREINKPKIEYSDNVLKETTQANIQVEIQEFTKKELMWWESFAISKKTLEKFKVFSIKHIFLNGNYHSSSSDTSPIYGYYGGKNSDGVELWRLYMPNKIKYRFLSNWKATKIQGVNRLPKESDHLVITKSMKDVMALYECGITAIAPNSENLFLTEKQYSKVKSRYKNIFLLYDLDLPGVRAANKIRKDFPDIKVLLLPRKSRCKDFSDFVKKRGLTRTFDLISKARSYYLTDLDNTK